MHVSIVICTDGRAEALANTLRCLQYLDGPAFEVCIVRGPTEDGTRQVIAEWSGAGRIKVGCNPERNLSVSRNIGIAMAAGEIVAFVDDDGLPEPEWLRQILCGFDDPRVAGAGGIVMDHTGARVQYYYSSADRLGNADWQRDTPADGYSFPLSFNFPYVQGTNSAFRRNALLAIGGFDEEFEFYLDETDVCCRLVDHGWLIRQLPNAIVHHKFLPSAIRTADRVTRVLYPVLKNKLYFSLLNNRGHYPVRRAIEDFTAFAQIQEAGLRQHVEAGRLPGSDLDAFQADVDRAWTVGLERGMSGQRRLLQPALMERHNAPFLEFPRLQPIGGREVFAFISQEYPPGRMGGIGRYIHQMARAVAALGHHVHVLTPGEGHDRVDFEEGVWVHRIVPRPALPAPAIAIPHHIWAHASTMLDVLRGIARRQSVSAVYAPIWDCEGAAVLLDREFPLVTGLQTTLRFWLDSHPHIAADETFRRDFAEPMLELEARLLRESDVVHAISGAICRDISRAYRLALEPPRTEILPLGMEDWTGFPSKAPTQLPEGWTRLLFVGRLEARKGIDVLLDVLPQLLARHPNMHVDIVGNDRILGPDGRTYRAAFEASAQTELLTRVWFHGEVTDEQLRGFYRTCDIFVAPSRFESFGLILVEAMMYGKPIVACRTGGMTEVAADGETALLARPGDTTSLEECLERLMCDPLLRQTLGEAGRLRYEDRFAPAPMAAGVVALLRRARAMRTTLIAA
ncbi:MAG TPA: glycosyltransferase [Acetobacteraceae bacterium]|nr:glycosyltransferase [Acetobacteraceae bacterium]